MPRPRKERCCRELDGDVVYKPVAVPLARLDLVELRLDEFEALRLCDLEGLEQSEAGQRMGVSRGTVQRLLVEARKKLVGAMVDGRAIRILANPVEDKDERP